MMVDAEGMKNNMQTLIEINKQKMKRIIFCNNNKNLLALEEKGCLK